MNNGINQIRKKIRALRVSMLQAEVIMHDQINRDEKCFEIAAEIMLMRSVMSALVQERTRLGDREPILVNCFFIPRRAPAAPRPVSNRHVKRHLVSAGKRAG
jgi:hypothetical protein